MNFWKRIRLLAIALLVVVWLTAVVARSLMHDDAGAAPAACTTNCL